MPARAAGAVCQAPEGPVGKCHERKLVVPFGSYFPSAAHSIPRVTSSSTCGIRTLSATWPSEQ